MGKQIDAYVVCPFYKRNESQMIICEGVKKGTTVHLAFSDSTELKSYKKEYCKCRYQDCLITKMLNRKYESEEKA